MTSLDLKMLRAEASILKNRIRSLLVGASVAVPGNEDLASEDIANELMAEYGSREAAAAAVRAIAASLSQRSRAADDARVEGMDGRQTHLDGISSTPRLNARAATAAAARTPLTRAWRTRGEDRLAAAGHGAGTSGEFDDGRNDAPVVAHVPGATDGSAALGYLCGGSNDVVVTGALDGLARVVFAGKDYPLASIDAWGLRVVEGMSRQDLVIWLADGGIRTSGFAVFYE